jgi:hypothetical protein
MLTGNAEKISEEEQGEVIKLWRLLVDEDPEASISQSVDSEQLMAVLLAIIGFFSLKPIQGSPTKLNNNDLKSFLYQ